MKETKRAVAMDVDMNMLVERIDKLEMKVYDHDKRIENVEEKEVEIREDMTLLEKSMNAVHTNIDELKRTNHMDTIRIIGISIIIFSITLLLFKIIGI